MRSAMMGVLQQCTVDRVAQFMQFAHSERSRKLDLVLGPACCGNVAADDQMVATVRYRRHLCGHLPDGATLEDLH